MYEQLVGITVCAGRQKVSELAALRSLAHDRRPAVIFWLRRREPNAGYGWWRVCSRHHRIGPDVGLGFSAPIAMWYVFIGKRVEDSKGLVGEPRRRRQVWPVRKVATHEIHDRRRAAIGRGLPSHRRHPPGLARWRREVAMPSRMPVDLPPPPRHLGDAVRSSRIWLKWRCTRS